MGYRRLVRIDGFGLHRGGWVAAAVKAPEAAAGQLLEPVFCIGCLQG